MDNPSVWQAHCYHEIPLRNSSTDLYIPRLRTSMGQKSFGYRGVRFWNNLIDEAIEAKTYFAFKRILSKRIKQ